MYRSGPDAHPFVSFLQVEGPAVVEDDLVVSYLEYATVEVERRSAYDDLGVDAGKGVWGFMADGEGAGVVSSITMICFFS